LRASNGFGLKEGRRGKRFLTKERCFHGKKNILVCKERGRKNGDIIMLYLFK